MFNLDLDKIRILAQKNLSNAYAPYSRFPVSAVIVARSGRTYVGVNVENSAFPLSRCAEQVAVGAMVAAGDRDIKLILIHSTTSPPAAPCGACRQIISEFAEPDTSVICVNQTGEEVHYTIGELLPVAFKLDESL